MPSIEQRRTIEAGARGIDEGKGIGREANSANRHKDIAHLQGVKITNMSKRPDGWHNNNQMDWSDITGFIEVACTVLAASETVDFMSLPDGKGMKQEIQSTALAIICKGLNSILLSDSD